MKTIDKLQQELKGENRKEIIDSFEETIAEDIITATKEKQFFSLPLNNILNIVSKTNLSEQEDPISLIKSLITKTIEAHSRTKKTLLLLHSLKTNDIELTLESCIDILSLFAQCDDIYKTLLGLFWGPNIFTPEIFTPYKLITKNGLVKHHMLLTVIR